MAALILRSPPLTHDKSTLTYGIITSEGDLETE